MAQKDLIPMNERTEEEQKRIASKGGKASGAARRRKRTIRDAARLILSMSVQDTETIETLKAAGIENPGGLNNLEAMVAVAIAKAKAGDLKALEFIRDSIGENPQLAAYNERTEVMKKNNSRHSEIADDWVQAVLAADDNK